MKVCFTNQIGASNRRLLGFGLTCSITIKCSCSIMKSVNWLLSATHAHVYLFGRWTGTGKFCWSGQLPLLSASVFLRDWKRIYQSHHSSNTCCEWLIIVTRQRTGLSTYPFCIGEFHGWTVAVRERWGHLTFTVILFGLQLSWFRLMERIWVCLVSCSYTCAHAIILSFLRKTE